jgi:4-hydroxyphenylacetaldehyde oxime monooxygenase
MPLLVPTQLVDLRLQWQIPIILFLVPLSLFLRGRWWSGSLSKKGRLYLPPCPPGLPIIGNLHQMAGALPHQSLWELARRHGPVMLLRLGRVPVLVVSSAEAARDVLKTHDADCCTRPDTPGPRRISYNHKDLSFSPYSDHWRLMRKLFVLEFRSKRLLQAIWETREAEVSHPLLVQPYNINNQIKILKPILLDEETFQLFLINYIIIIRSINSWENWLAPPDYGNQYS